MKPNQDLEHLRLLSVFHYVAAGVSAVFSMFPLIHVTMGIAIVAGAFDDVDSSTGEPPPEFLGWMFIGIGATIIIIGLICSLMMVIAGRKLSKQRSYMFCFVVASIECLFMPVGTALGVFTIIVLMRPNVKMMFGVPVNMPNST